MQEALQAERQHFVEERDRLRKKLRGEELVIETRKLKDELIRLRRVRQSCALKDASVFRQAHPRYAICIYLLDTCSNTACWDH